MGTEAQIRAWCRRIQESDREAFEQAYRALYEGLLHYAHSIVHSEAAAQDVVQQAFMEVWDMRSDLDPDRSLKALLYRIVRNRAYNQKRNEKNRRSKREEMQRTTTAAQDDPQGTLDAETLQNQLDAWINDLPERQREALRLSRFDDLSHDEIAAVMGISPRTVNNHIVRALRRLREHVRAYDPSLL
jgi:RNA polymerase sigma-70 factor (ECF subfamily)